MHTFHSNRLLLMQHILFLKCWKISKDVRDKNKKVKTFFYVYADYV